MKVLESQTGILHVIVSSEGNTIMNGTPVVIKTIVADKDIEVHVISTRTTVRLPYYDTDVEWLLGLN